MNRLSIEQLSLLKAASRLPNGVMEVSLYGRGATQTANSLVRRGLFSTYSAKSVQLTDAGRALLTKITEPTHAV